jgi:hypothetical protein
LEAALDATFREKSVRMKAQQMRLSLYFSLLTGNVT